MEKCNVMNTAIYWSMEANIYYLWIYLLLITYLWAAEVIQDLLINIVNIAM